jgi:hypothetical protein
MSVIDKLNNLASSKKFMMVLSYVGLYLLTAGLSLALFSYLRGGPSLDLLSGSLEDRRSKINLELPRTEECPINGGMFTTVERNIWQERRPITAMIENHADSRPTGGLNRADVVYEAVAEGGITRFLGVFYCGAAAEDVEISPVRSARIYYVNWAAEYGDYPIFMHVGGANRYGGTTDTTAEADALGLLEDLGWRVPQGNDFDTTYDSGFPIFWRDYERLDKPSATEHTMTASLDAAYKEAAERGFGAKYEGVAWDKNFDEWMFEDDSPTSSPNATEISFSFWDRYSDYDVTWKYNRDSNSYLRENGGREYVDLHTKEQINTKNVVVQFVRERGPVDRNLHMIYTTIGEGDALIFKNGEVIEGTWEKDSRTDRTIFYDERGNEIEFVRGPIWIEAVPDGNDVDY